MDAEAQDVIVVAQVEALHMQLTVVDHAHRCYVVQHLPALRVKQVVPAVVATVTAQRNHFIILFVFFSIAQTDTCDHAHL